MVCFVGKSNSGKTTIVTKVIAELKRRELRVAAIKHSHHAGEFDQPGKDSWRMAEAGADAIGYVSPQRTFVLINTERETPVDHLTKFFIDFDIVVMEGFKSGTAPRIEVVREANGGKLVCPVNELLAIVSDIDFEHDVPLFNMNEIDGISDFLVDQMNIDQQISKDN